MVLYFSTARSLGKIGAFLLLLFIPVMLMAQTSEKIYEERWEKIDQLINEKGLRKDALTEVNKLSALAAREKNEPQRLKALVYRIILSEPVQDDDGSVPVSMLEKELASARGVSVHILQSMLAEQYWRYLQQNRWRLYDRTNMASGDKNAQVSKDALASWTADDLHRKITALYKASLEESAILQKVSLSGFEALLLKGNVRHLRPTLYDLLAFRALDYYTSGERTITRPADAFRIDRNAAFDPADHFIRVKFTTQDTTSLYFRALLLYQDLIRFHLADKEYDALLDADLQRLSFVKEHAVQPDKDSLWRMSVRHIAHQYGNHPVADQAWFLLAEELSERAATYQPLGDTTHRYAYREALDICRKVMARPDSTEGKINCSRLAARITHKELELRTETVNLPGQPFKSLIGFRNISTVYIRYIRMTNALATEWKTNRYEEAFWRRVQSLPAFRSAVQQLPSNTDHQLHKVEIAHDALPVGDYLLFVSADSTFSLTGSVLALHRFHVSNIAFVQKGKQVYVANRDSGEPLAGANVEWWIRQYNNVTRKNEAQLLQSAKTNKHGLATFVPLEKNRHYSIEVAVQWGKERLLPDERQVVSYWNADGAGPEKANTRSYLFTDRSIYRPGQQVHVKGLIVDESARSKVIRTGLSSKLYLFNANYEAIDSVTVTTSRFGSYAAVFRLPLNGLNGNFQIRDAKNNGYHSFRVEEYKRPRFSVELKQPGGMFRVNDSVSVPGNAMAFAGNTIAGARVSYRVVRSQWWNTLSRIWPPYPPRPEAEIANGAVVTDDNGHFTVKFKAIPDETGAINKEAFFQYEIMVDVTDINGETRSASTALRIGYRSVALSFGMPGEMPADSLKGLTLYARNSSDSAQSIPATIHIYALKTPGRLFRKRLWEQPDQFVMSKDAFVRMFPLDIYNNENEPVNWEMIPEPVFSSSYHTSKTGAWEKDAPALKPGWYLVEAIATDAFAEQVKTRSWLHLTGKEPDDVMFRIRMQADPARIKAGAPTTVRWSANFGKPVLIKDVTRPGGSETEIIAGKKDQGQYEITSAESDRGGIRTGLSAIRHNRFYSQDIIAEVPWSNKELHITTASFRDKLLPGAKETWSLTIHPGEGAPDSAEVLASMYDASLDEFTAHNWNRPFWGSNYTWEPWNGEVGFDVTTAFVKGVDVPAGPNLVKEYDRLIAPGYSYSGYVGMALRGRVPGLVANAEIADAVLEKREEMAVSTITQQFAPPTAVAGQERKDAPGAYPAVRANLSETAFFFPQLVTDSSGALTFSFTVPEALTKWKWMSFAHTRDMATGYLEKTILTQKDLMVQPNLPRFLREGDRMDLSAKIANLTGKELTGQVELQLLDADTRTPVDGWFQNIFPNQYFTANAAGSTVVNFSIQVPYQYSKPLVVRLIARSGDHSDGEETLLPVLSNKMLVTETLPLYSKGNGVKTYTWEKLKDASDSETLQHQSLTVEFSANPTWYVVQALPSLLEQANPCADEIFARFYAQAVATGIFRKAPQLKQVLEQWLKGDTSSLVSPLEKNPELKAVLLEETPWVMEARSTTEQMRRLRLLLDLAAVEKDMKATLQQLKDLQTSNGGFSWFPGGADNRYITQTVATGLGRLKRLGLIPASVAVLAGEMYSKAVAYLDARLLEDYKEEQKRKVKTAAQPFQVYHLYMRSFYPEIPVPEEIRPAYTYYRAGVAANWQKQSRYMQGLIAQVLLRNNEPSRAGQILQSIKQYAVTTPEKGMYWKDNVAGYSWHQSPLEVQSLLIEAFSEKGGYTAEVNEMKTWLLLRKQATGWGNNVATANACYALLLNGAGWISATPRVSVALGEKTVSQEGKEPGAGYVKTYIPAKEITPGMEQVKFSVSGNADGMPVWGSVYWQYFEQSDKITAAGGALSLQRKYFLQKNTAAGPVLEEINDLTPLRPGDRIVVRMIATTDRDLDFVHLKDQRAASLEPLQALSGYQWKDGLGYYQSAKDASVQFFFDRLPKGTHVLEYPMLITHTGVFSTGIGTLQCLYAPEFTAHSEGAMLRVE